MHRRTVPIGIRTFAKIREAHYHYVDKTAFIRQLINEGTLYFLSRPRRFGKSQLIDTLAELSGLDLAEIRRWYNGYNWMGEAVYNPFDLLLLFQEREFRTCDRAVVDRGAGDRERCDPGCRGVRRNHPDACRDGYPSGSGRTGCAPGRCGSQDPASRPGAGRAMASSKRRSRPLTDGGCAHWACRSM